MPIPRSVLRLPRLPSLSGDDCRLLVDSVVDYAIFMMDETGRIATWNPGAEKIKGYTASEIIGQHFSIFYPPEDNAAGKPERELEIAIAQGRVEDEGWRVRRDGSLLWASVVITALRDESGTLRGFAKVTRDLSARRQVEDELRRSEERFRLLIDNIADYAIYMLDQEGRISTWNRGAERMKGYTAEEIIGRNFAILFPEADVQDGKPLRELANARALGRFEDEGWRVRKDGTRFWANALITGVHDSSGALVGFAKITRDLTARREAEETARRLLREQTAREVAEEGELRLRQSEAKYRALSQRLEIVLEGERQQERHSKYLADASAALASSLDQGEMLSKLAQLLVPGVADWCAIYLLEGAELKSVAVAHADPERLAQAKNYCGKFPPDAGQTRGVWNVQRTGEPELYNDLSEQTWASAARSPEQLAVLRAVGMKAVLLVPIRIREQVAGVLSLVSAESARRYGPADLALAHEIGQRAGVAIDNARMYRAAQVAAQLADEASRAKDEFLATVSHELRTPLNAIVGWSTLLKSRVTDAALANPIAVIHRNAQAQVKIIDDILDVARVINGKFRLELKPTDLVAISRDAIEVVRPGALAKNIELTFAPHTNFRLLVADPERLQQVVWNLLSNAVKFTNPGGKIELTVDQEGSEVVLTVKDTGAGIHPSFLPLVFERFKQADSSTTRRFGGLGLGLAIVRHIVELHGGRVAAHSEGLGKGSSFSIALPIRALSPPLRPSQPPAAPAESTPSVAQRLTGVRVLIVDDEPDARELITTVLLECEADVQTASSAGEAFQAFLRFRPDVLVSDIAMADDDGLSLMRRIRQLPASEGGSLPSLALSAFTGEEHRMTAIDAGYTMHLGKPVSPDALISAVAALSALAIPRIQRD